MFEMFAEIDEQHQAIPAFSNTRITPFWKNRTPNSEEYLSIGRLNHNPKTQDPTYPEPLTQQNMITP